METPKSCTKPHKIVQKRKMDVVCVCVCVQLHLWLLPSYFPRDITTIHKWPRPTSVTTSLHTSPHTNSSAHATVQKKSMLCIQVQVNGRFTIICACYWLEIALNVSPLEESKGSEEYRILCDTW
jgi:hypothetical protein